MNAITTTNHLMGEVSGLIVMLDSFGGALLRSGDSLLCGRSDDVERNVIGVAADDVGVSRRAFSVSATAMTCVA